MPDRVPSSGKRHSSSIQRERLRCRIPSPVRSPRFCGSISATKSACESKRTERRAPMRGCWYNASELVVPFFCSRRRSEEHTSELQSLRHLVCRLLLEKKKKYIIN